jgi:hypothetical protein
VSVGEEVRAWPLEIRAPAAGAEIEKAAGGVVSRWKFRLVVVLLSATSVAAIACADGAVVFVASNVYVVDVAGFEVEEEADSENPVAATAGNEIRLTPELASVAVLVTVNVPVAAGL